MSDKMQFEGPGSDVISHIVNTVIRTIKGRSPREFSIYLGQEEFTALWRMDIATSYKVGFTPMYHSEPRELLGVKVFVVSEDNHFKIYEN